MGKRIKLREAHVGLFAILDKHYEVNLVCPEELAGCDRQDFQMVFISSGGVEYMFRDHFESRSGVAIQGHLPEGTYT